MKEIQNDVELWKAHPLGAPNRNTCAVFEIEGHLFALGRYNQYADDKILSLTRHMVRPGAGRASRALALLRREVKRRFGRYLALQTYTDSEHEGTCYRADGWVFVASHRGKKRWVRTL